MPIQIQAINVLQHLAIREIARAVRLNVEFTAEAKKALAEHVIIAAMLILHVTRFLPVMIRMANVPQ